MKKTLGGLMVALCLCLAGCAAHGQHTQPARQRQPVHAAHVGAAHCQCGSTGSV